jgi:hypothetical protein
MHQLISYPLVLGTAVTAAVIGWVAVAVLWVSRARAHARCTGHQANEREALITCVARGDALATLNAQVEALRARRVVSPPTPAQHGPVTRPADGKPAQAPRTAQNVKPAAPAAAPARGFAAMDAAAQLAQADESRPAGISNKAWRRLQRERLNGHAH